MDNDGFLGAIRNVTNNDWVIIVIIVNLIIFIIGRILHQTHINSVFKTGIYMRSLNVHQKGRNIIIDNATAWLLGVTGVNVTLFIYYCLKYWKTYLFVENTLFQFFLYGLIIMGFSLMKYILIKLSGLLFDKRNLFKEYLINKYVYFQILGIIILPLVCIIPFVPEYLERILIYLTIICFIIVYLISIYRSIQIFNSKQFFKLYMIMYLCALEILPILVLGKFFYSLIYIE
ncbi:DUF4271 domain-containing protein [Bacteroidota bacterium]